MAGIVLAYLFASKAPTDVEAPPAFYIGLFFVFLLMIWLGWRSWIGPPEPSKDLRFQRGPGLGLMGLGGIMCLFGAGCIVLFERFPNMIFFVKAALYIGAFVTLLPGCIMMIVPLSGMFWIPTWARPGAGTKQMRKRVRSKVLGVFGKHR
jgi:hypothetical protein